jgi:hypothetical protein
MNPVFIANFLARVARSRRLPIARLIRHTFMLPFLVVGSVRVFRSCVVLARHALRSTSFHGTPYGTKYEEEGEDR